MTDTVRNNTDKNRYELSVDGHLAATYYRIADGVVTFVHTEVPDALAGRGVGSQLVKGALDQVRAAGLKVVPQCPFVRAYVEKHPDYADLLKYYALFTTQIVLSRPQDRSCQTQAVAFATTPR